MKVLRYFPQISNQYTEYLEVCKKKAFKVVTIEYIWLKYHPSECEIFEGLKDKLQNITVKILKVLTPE